MLSNVKNFFDSLNRTHGWLFKKSSLVMLFSMTGVAILFILQILMARQMGAKEFGIYSYVLSWVILLSLFSTFGFEQLQVRYISSFATEGKGKALASLLAKSRNFVFFLGVFITITGSLLIKLFNSSNDDSITTTFFIGLLSIPILGVIRSNYGALRGFNEPVKASIMFEIMRPLFFMLILVVALYYLDKFTALNVMLINLFSLTGVLFFSMKWVNKCRDKNLASMKEKNIEKYYIKEVHSYLEWGKVAFPFIMIAGAVQIQKNTDIIMLGWLNSMESAGIYTIATRITHAMILISGILNSVAAPIISSLFTENRDKELTKIISLIAKVGALAAFFMAMLFYFFGKDILLLFGEEFAHATNTLKILVIGQFIYTLAGPIAIVAMMTNNQNLALKSHIVAAITNIILNSILIPLWGLEGAAIATSLSLILWCILLSLLIKKSIGINTTVLT